MLVSVLVVPVGAIAEDSVTVHYYNENNWSNPYIYYYDGDNQPVTWPGTAMTNDGNGWFSYTISGMSQAKVIFSNNGANQYPAQNQPGFDISGEKWFANGNCYDSEPEAITVHFQNYDNWNNVNIYYYNGEREGTSWTGVPMNADGDGWYTYKIFDYNEARVLFNNGNGAQIPPAMEPGFLVSGEMWYRNGTWTTERPEEITVYFYKPDNWSAPNIYYYKNDSDTGPAWPGTAMQQVQDNWYTYTITKYSEAKVMFNSGSDQIPAQNQPGLDAKGIMWYKDGVWCDMETDTDNDSLPDYMELALGTNIAKADTDNDGLPDGYEVYTLGTDPTKADSDSNGKNDGAEDADNDGLTNLKECQLGTDPTKDDSDNDGLKDGEEVNTYKTDPLKKDTDGDTLSDGDDVALGFSPLKKDTDDNGVLDCDEKLQQSLTQEIDCEEKPQVTDVTVSFEGSGNINSNTTIENIYNIDMLSSGVVGLVGAPVEIKTESKFDEAVITFKVDKTKLGETEFKNLGILWYDEESKLFRMQDVTLDEGQGTVSATVTHFSKYMVVDKKAWFDTWQHKIVYDTEVEDIQTVLAIDCSGSMSWNDPGIYYYNHHVKNTYRELAAEKYIDAMRADVDMASLVMFDSFATAFVHMTNDKEALYDGLSNITSWSGTNFDDAITVSLGEFDESSEASKTIILLTDGQDWVSDSVLENAVDKGVVIYVVGIGSDIDSTVLQHIADYTGGEFYVAKTASEIVDIYSNVQLNQHIDATDTDGDGLADIFETAGMRLPDGRIVYTDPLKWDTDGDGIKDGDEIYIGGYETIDVKIDEYGSYEFKYDPGVQFYMLSDPNNAYSDYDKDGIPDNEDTAPFERGIGGGVIGEMTIVSSANYDSSRIDFGHSFLVYKSYINDTIDFSGFYSGYDMLPYCDGSGYSIGEVEKAGFYRIKRNGHVTMGNAARNTKDELDIFLKSSYASSGSSVGVDGGTWYNWEIMKAKNEDEQYKQNYALTHAITESQLKIILDYHKEYNYYNLFTNNCSKVTAQSWNLAFNDNLNTRGNDLSFYFHTPMALKSSISERPRAFEFDLLKITGEFNDR